MFRATYLVAYDVSCPLRLRRVAELVKSHRVSGQKSVAECLLNERERETLLAQLGSKIDSTTDRLNFFRLDPRQRPLTFGIAETFDGGPFLIL